MITDVEEIAQSARTVLEQSPDAPVRLRLLRDVLGRNSGDPELDAAVAALDDSPHVQTLAKEQWADGSWGRLHSTDYAAKQRIGTTEIGVERATELGLARSHQILQSTQSYLEAVLEGRACIPDRAEKHENWPTGVTMFAGAALSGFAPKSSALDDTWDFWSAVVRRSFATGKHDLDAELRTHRQLLGRSGDCGWLRLHSKYVVMILGSRAKQLPSHTETAYVRWLWERCPKGLVYVDVPLESHPLKLRGWRLHAWLRLLELLSAFPSARHHAGPAIARLLEARTANNLWDFGVQPSCPRLSDSYRKRQVIAHDWTTQVACLLRRYT